MLREVFMIWHSIQLCLGSSRITNLKFWIYKTLQFTEICRSQLELWTQNVLQTIEDAMTNHLQAAKCSFCMDLTIVAQVTLSVSICEAIHNGWSSSSQGASIILIVCLKESIKNGKVVKQTQRMLKSWFQSFSWTIPTFWKIKWNWIWASDKTANVLTTSSFRDGRARPRTFSRSIDRLSKLHMFQTIYINGLIWYLAANRTQSMTTTCSIHILTRDTSIFPKWRILERRPPMKCMWESLGKRQGSSLLVFIQGKVLNQASTQDLRQPSSPKSRKMKKSKRNRKLADLQPSYQKNSLQSSRIPLKNSTGLMSHLLFRISWPQRT